MGTGFVGGVVGIGVPVMKHLAKIGGKAEAAVPLECVESSVGGLMH